MIVTTTPSIEGHAIRDYRGIVIGEVIVGANLFRDLFASITDIVGGRSGKYENVLKRARATKPWQRWKPRPRRSAPMLWSASILTMRSSAKRDRC